MEKIAIIGFSCLLPDAKNPEEFWHNLIEQKDSTSSITVEEIEIGPENFYNPVKGKSDKFYSLKGGFVRDFNFDPTGYKLPGEFLSSLDNTFKWSLHTAKEALKHSGYLENQAVLSKCGVILGTLSLPTKYSNQLFAPIYQQILSPVVQELLQQEQFELASLPASEETSIYNAMISGLPAAIIAQAFSLSNIHFCLDAACSSPQYAIKLASHYLWTHKADLMLAGGISCADPLFIRMLFSGIQGYPEDNDLSRPFDKSSRGLVTADGVGIFVLKRYSDAVRDGDRIYATICGNGLSNDGKGKHLLSPNPKGQILAFERAYTEAEINPQDIDYLECHATGTMLGDTTEFQSIETFFGKYQATPLVGSVKSNIGHLLTAAGAVSLIKVLLSMSRGVVPATINITDPIGTEDNVISPGQIVTSATNWQNHSANKRAGISAFGLGGTNAHMIVEQTNTSTTETIEAIQPLQPVKMAIVGMDAFFGGCDGLDAFERSIYEGTQHFIPLPPNRWHGIEDQEKLLKNYGLADGKPPIGAYIKDFEIDTIESKIPPNELSHLNLQQILMQKVAGRALKDAGIQQGANVAVIIATEAEFSVHQLQQRWNLPWQVKEGLIAGEISLTPEKIAQLETIVQDSIHHPVDSSEYVSYITNIMASRISSQWDFTAPVFTITAGENSTFKVLEVAQHLLTTGEADAVLVGAVDLSGGMENILLRSKSAKINTGVNTLSYDQKADGWMIGEGAGAVVLKRQDLAKEAGVSIYAVVDAITFTQETANQETGKMTALTTAQATAVSSVCQKAFDMAGIQAGDVNYLEVYGSGRPQEDEAEIKGLIQAYPGSINNLSCAIGSVKANIGHTYVASGIASLIKTALCLYYRYIPATPKWSGVKNHQLWQGSPFYVAPESRPWFLDQDATRRIAAINSIGIDGSYAHLILSEEPNQEGRRSNFLQQTPFYLFPIAGNNSTELLQQANALQQTIDNGTSLVTAAKEAFTTFKQREDANFVLVILAHNQKELAREIESAHKGVSNAFAGESDWQTPLGSYFTAKPLGKVGEVAYVYPAAVNSYLNIGQNLFRLFPKLHEDAPIKALQNLVAENTKLLYPRSLNKLSLRQLESLEKQLLDDSLAMFDTDMVITRFITTIIRDEFKVKPKFAFGYSLGETSMMAATGVWDDVSQGIIALHKSNLFADRLTGTKAAVREYWQLPLSVDNNFWCNYVLLASPLTVRECIKNESRVYLTQINTPEEVVIAGEPTACERVIKTLGCNAFRAPFDHVIHCDPINSEYEEIARVNTITTLKKIQDIKLYSASEYEPIVVESQAIANSIAKCLCTQLDFPRLVNRVYNDGAKIFIEVGAGNVCSRWIDKILENKEHTTVTLNRRGLDDHSSLLKALAKLLSHRVSLDLSPLYNQTEQILMRKKPIVKTATLGGQGIASKILTPENRKNFQNISTNKKHHSIPQSAKNIPKDENVNNYPTKQEEIPMKNIKNNSIDIKDNLESIQPVATSQKNSPQLQPSQLAKSHYQKINANNSSFTKAHTKFLKNRQEFSQQMSEIIQLQLACAENLLNQSVE